MNNPTHSEKGSCSFPDTTRQPPLMPNKLKLHGLSEPRRKDLTLWFERLYDYTSSRGIEGTINFERLDDTDPQTVTCIFRGTISEHESTGTDTTDILDDPLSLQLDTNGRLYSLGLIEPSGMVYITEEFGRKRRHLSRNGLWSTPVETEPTGDLAHVRRQDDSTVFLVIDGLGHGKKANKVSQLARNTVGKLGQESPAYLMESIHEALKGTRGAVALTGRINHDALQLDYCSVGNIKAKLVKNNTTKRFIAENGTLGYSLPDNFKQHTTKLRRGNSIVCHSDGVETPNSEYFDDLFGRLSPSLNAVRIHDQFKKGHDDALVFVSTV